VAGALNSIVRGTDVLARYGGEEFVIILPGADAGDAYHVAERARSAVAALNEPHAMAPSGFVTVSIGVAGTVPAPDAPVERLIQSADAELYDAKREGRNTVRSIQIN